MAEIRLGIEMSGQEYYVAACKKYGSDFADAIVAQECQLFVDSIDCFDECAKADEWQDMVVGSLEAKKEHEEWLKENYPEDD